MDRPALVRDEDPTRASFDGPGRATTRAAPPATDRDPYGSVIGASVASEGFVTAEGRAGNDRGPPRGADSGATLFTGGWGHRPRTARGPGGRSRSRRRGRTGSPAGYDRPRRPCQTRCAAGRCNDISAPTDFSGAARVHLDVPTEVLEGADRALLRVSWTGDVGRALIGGDVVSDHFWHGRVWDIDLTPRRSEVSAHGVTLELLPWRRDVGVWVDPSVRDVEDGITIGSVDVVRVQRVQLDLV